MGTESPPEISVEELAQKLKSSSPFIVLDVREAWEVDLVGIRDARVEARPVSQLARDGLDALPASARARDAEIYVLCQHGMRSASVTSWLVARGWKKVFSVSGGLDEYARKIDPSIGRY
jgi:rhodanese-related sulfurtransferase